MPFNYNDLQTLHEIIFCFSDVLSYDLCINHATSSPADAFNVRLRWMFPNILTFRILNQTVDPEIRMYVYSSYFDVEVRQLMHCTVN